MAQATSTKCAIRSMKLFNWHGSMRSVALSRRRGDSEWGTVTTNSASLLAGSDQTEPTATAAVMRPAATGAARPCSIEVGPPVNMVETARGECDPPFKPHDRPDAPDEGECQTLSGELPCEDEPE